MFNATKRPNASKLINRNTVLKIAFVLAVIIISATLVKPSGAVTAFTVPFHSGSIWNKPIPANPALKANSGQMVQQLASTVNGAVNIDGITGSWSVPVYYGDANTPKQMVCDADGYRACVPVPIPA